MRVRLDVAAAIRVGGREQEINKLEYIRHGGKLYAVNPRKLAQLLQSKSERTLDDWSTEVLTMGQHADLTSFLRDKGLLDRETVEQVSRYSARCDHSNLNEFHPHARDAFDKLFVPGTAIKGAIRSAVMWELVDEETANGYFAEKEREAEEPGRRLSRDRLARDLDQRTLQSYRLLRPGGTAAHRDLLRAVKVSDAHDGELESRIEKVTVQSYAESPQGRTASHGVETHVECLTPGSWIEFDLKVDKKILRNFERENEGIPFKDEASLLQLARNFYAEVWSFEQGYYGAKASQDEEQAPVEEPEKFPEMGEWIEQNYGKLSKTQQRRYRGEYRVAREAFEAGLGGQEEPSKKNPGIRDGEIKVGKIKAFYSGDCPGFRLGWGSGLMSTTVDLHLGKENMGKVLNVISNKHHPGAAPIEGPKSRKLVERDSVPCWPMGWARLEVKV